MKSNKKTITLGLSGATGRMGKAVNALVRKKNSNFKLVHNTPPLDFNQWRAHNIQGVIDFSAPLVFSEALKWCVKNKKPFVSGTTALSPAHKRLLKTSAKKIPIFYEENMSWGIWQIKKWIETLSNPPLNIVLQDIHHKNKKDKPSGTALKLKRHFAPSIKNRLKVVSYRRGQEFGTHRLLFKADEEQVLLEHVALSRKLFAGGALKALRWLVAQKTPGLYCFEDLYKDKKIK